MLDRLGCRDTDGDGWSDPTASWAAHPAGTADAFPTEALQWRDLDGDGFGDVPLGAFRDDCPEQAGTSKRDVQGCIDSNNDGWSDEYGEFAAAVAILGESPEASWLTYLVIGLGFIAGAGAALFVRSGKDDADIEDALFEEKQSRTLEEMGQELPLPGMIALQDLPPLPMPAGATEVEQDV